MAPKSKAELMRESRKRKKENALRKSEEFQEFLENTPCRANITDAERFDEFLRSRTRTPKTPLQRNRESRKRKADANDRSQQDANRLRMREVRRKKKEALKERQAETVEQIDSNSIDESPRKIFIDEQTVAYSEFSRRFKENQFGVSCGVCDRLSFERDMKNVSESAIEVIGEKYPDAHPSSMRVCGTCYNTLSVNKILRLATMNGFQYPLIPSNLSPLDPISERYICMCNCKCSGVEAKRIVEFHYPTRNTSRKRGE